ncbi:Magnetosome protein MamI-2 [Candidatus Desulfarcum epimagneticum]|uniref:Magnetosome protein MamI-2 n=1 Tax=uncultured Desulfobacteraceae bacterium TaxID=218296 RepID=A0A484HFQ5_9BACT|nr:Magnetosome protein MamI-2 [uncultured Desulfobacteraceae bacterium]
MENNGKRPRHIIGGVVVFAAGLFLGLNNMLYVVEFIKGALQPVFIIMGLTAAAAIFLNKENSLRWLNAVIALVFLPLGVYGVYDEYYATMDFINGFLPILLVVVGLVALAHGIKQIGKES